MSFLLLFTILSISNITFGYFLNRGYKLSRLPLVSVSSSRFETDIITDTQIELLITNNYESKLDLIPPKEKSRIDTIKKRCKKDRELVEAAMHRFQRFTLQMDRSDGRPDLTYDILCDRYYDFMGTMLRNEGEAWRVGTAGLEYIGFKMDTFLQREINEKCINIDIAKLAYVTCTFLLDLDSSKLKSVIDTADKAKILKVQDVILAVLRLTVRHAISETNGNLSSSLKIKSFTGLQPDAQVIVPSYKSVKTILDLDAYCECCAVEESPDCIVIDEANVNAWATRLKID
jgi:hypothetical protein